MRNLIRKNSLVLSEFEADLHKITSNELTYPTERDLLSVAAQARDSTNAAIAVKHLFEKLQSPRDKWRKILKALFLIEVMLVKGNKLLASELNSKLFLLKTLLSEYRNDIEGASGQSHLISFQKNRGSSENSGEPKFRSRKKQQKLAFFASK